MPGKSSDNEHESKVQSKLAPSNEQQQQQQVKRNGFVVLGMHRSGTSMLSGLLVEGCGYNVGGPTFTGPANPKGFFELYPVVSQNDEFLKKQKAGWRFGVANYNNTKAIEQYKNGQVEFKRGKRALQFLNDPKSTPWLQKDPRMCITLPTWLPLLTRKPAVVFTYRHPLEVALSLKKREGNFGLVQGFKIWIHYNARGIQNSQGLCRIVTNNKAILSQPLKEVQQISNQLTTKCNVVAPPRILTQEKVDEFVDPKLHHQQQQEIDNRKVIQDYGSGCKAYEFDSSYKDGPRHEQEVEMYKQAMQLFCDMESGKAFESTYPWPEML